MKELKQFLTQEKIQSAQDERFVVKKRELIHKYFGTQSGIPFLERDIGIEDTDNFQRIDAILKKVSQLRDEVLGGPRSSGRPQRIGAPPAESIAKIDPYAKKLHHQARMLQASSPTHVWLYIRQGTKLYKIDTGTGLSECDFSKKTPLCAYDVEETVRFLR